MRMSLGGARECYRRVGGDKGRRGGGGYDRTCRDLLDSKSNDVLFVPFLCSLPLLP